jgi:GNAT superfamily N-acetyltransferase
MSGLAPIEPDVPPLAVQLAPSWHVRLATLEDVAAAAAAVRELLLELGSTPAEPAALEAAARALLDDPDAGALLVAQEGDQIVGVLGASWQIAIHVPGRYALIQDLWVHPRWRGQAIGRDLLAALFALARERRLARVEVGLPSERFARLPSTEAFYLENGFAQLGARMRLILP